MPIVPVFGGGGGGATPPTPPGSLTWLDVPTQIVNISTTATNEPVASLTLNAPTNGTGPFTYRVFPTWSFPSNLELRQYGTGNSQVQISGVRNLAQDNDKYQRGVAWKVIVEDSLGNWGAGLLIVYELDPDELATPALVLEQVLTPAQTSYQFPARTPPLTSSWINYNPLGTGFVYPSPVEPAVSTNHEATQFVVTVPAGGFCAFSYTRFRLSPNRYERVWMIVRRQMDGADMRAGWGPWEESQDFLDWANMPAFTPTMPLTSTNQGGTVIATNSATGRQYPMGNLANLQTTGISTPLVTDELSYSGGLAKIRTEIGGNQASNRQVWMSLLPYTFQTVQDTATRSCSLGTDSGLMVRVKFNLTLLGLYAFSDLRVGPAAYSGKYVGLRIRGRQNGFLIDGEESLVIQVVRGSSLFVWAAVRRSQMDGVDWGADFFTTGGQTWLTLYPWDPAWTDFPAYREDIIDFVSRPAGTIGPSSAAQDAAGFAAQGAPWSMGPWPLAQSDASLQTTNGNSVLAIHGGMNCGGNATAATNGGTLLIKDVKYEWCSLSLR